MYRLTQDRFDNLLADLRFIMWNSLELYGQTVYLGDIKLQTKAQQASLV